MAAFSAPRSRGHEAHFPLKNSLHGPGGSRASCYRRHPPADAERPRETRCFRLAPWWRPSARWPNRIQRAHLKMRIESVTQSIKMLKTILDGGTYGAVAREFELSRSAVEQRVKALARELQSVVGVERVDEDEVPTMKS